MFKGYRGPKMERLWSTRMWDGFVEDRILALKHMLAACWRVEVAG